MTGLVACITPNWYRNEPPKDEVYGQWMFGLNQTYVALIENSGFIPFCFLPMADEDSALRAVESVDLVVLTGGGDPDPDLWDCEVNGSRALQRGRPLWDMSVYRAARELGKPVVGICLGIQLIAVAEGSPLIQDISSQIEGALDHDGSAVSPCHQWRQVTHPMAFSRQWNHPMEGFLPFSGIRKGILPDPIFSAQFSKG